jgi:hypothetical protein
MSVYTKRNTILLKPNITPTTAGAECRIGSKLAWEVYKLTVVIETASTGDTHTLVLNDSADSETYATVAVTSSDAAGAVLEASVAIANRARDANTSLLLKSVTYDATAVYSAYLTCTPLG